MLLRSRNFISSIPCKRHGAIRTLGCRYSTQNFVQEKDQEIVRITTNWVRTFVYGLNLCPFSGGVLKTMNIVVNRKHINKSNTESVDLCNDILREAQDMIDGKAPTTLIVLPEFNDNFSIFLELCNIIDALLEENKLDQRIQVASFHPSYVFADSDEDSVDNYTNRSPHSIIHLLLVDEVILTHSLTILLTHSLTYQLGDKSD